MSMHYPSTSDWDELFAYVVSLACISVIGVLFGVKISDGRLQNLSSITYPRILVLMLYVASWAFSAMSMVLIVTNDGNIISCNLSILACNVFYHFANFIMFLWLIEKVWVVTCSDTKRMQTQLYRFHLALLTPYITAFILAIVNRVSIIEPNGTCTIGSPLHALIIILIFDFTFTSYITILFIRPLLTVGRNAPSDWSRSILHHVAWRNAIAAIVCLVVSAVNIFIFVLFHGHERGLVCLTSCIVDVTLNVIAVHWVTSSPRSSNAAMETPISRTGTSGVIEMDIEPTSRGSKYRLSGDRLSGHRLSGDGVSGHRLSGDRLSGERLGGDKLDVDKLDV